jgi:hypothetical protein
MLHSMQTQVKHMELLTCLPHNILEPLLEHPLQRNLICAQRSFLLHKKKLSCSYKFSPILS